MDNNIHKFVKYNTNGCMEMYGAAVRLAISDFKIVNRNYNKLLIEKKKISKNKNRNSKNICRLARLVNILHNYDSAKFFLFSYEGLEKAIDISGVPLNIDYVRRIALDKTEPLWLKKIGTANIEESHDY